jgi:death-on-curing protein
VKVSFLTLEDVLGLHASRIARYGGSLGLRDLGLLESALAVPCATFGGQFLHENLSEMASASLFHIVKNHPFVDGNKRTGLAAAIAFLDLNGHEIDADPAELADLVLGVADGSVSKAATALFLERHAPRLRSRRRRPAR